jgi:hypothetical protein
MTNKQLEANRAKSSKTGLILFATFCFFLLFLLCHEDFDCLRV